MVRGWKIEVVVAGRRRVGEKAPGVNTEPGAAKTGRQLPPHPTRKLDVAGRAP